MAVCIAGVIECNWRRQPSPSPTAGLLPRLVSVPLSVLIITVRNHLATGPGSIWIKLSPQFVNWDVDPDRVSFLNAWHFHKKIWSGVFERFFFVFPNLHEAIWLWSHFTDIIFRSRGEIGSNLVVWLYYRSLYALLYWDCWFCCLN